MQSITRTPGPIGIYYNRSEFGQISTPQPLKRQPSNLKPQTRFPDNFLFSNPKLKHIEQDKQLEIEEKLEEQQISPEQNAMNTWFRDTLKLPQYLELFVSQGFDGLDTMSDLTDFHLRELGIDKMGHRMKILKAVRIYNEKVIEEAAVEENNGEVEGMRRAAVQGANVQDTLKQSFSKQHFLRFRLFLSLAILS